MQNRTRTVGFARTPAPEDLEVKVKQRDKGGSDYLDNEQNDRIFRIIVSWVESLQDSTLGGSTIACGRG